MRNISKLPTVLTDAEVRAILTITGRAERDLRDHVLLVVALTTGLRVSELVGLDVAHVKNGKGVKTLVVLTPERTKGGKGGEVTLPERTRRKMASYLSWKKDKGEDVTDTAPLFCSRGGGRAGATSGSRLSVRSAEHIFSVWQARANFDRRLRFHALRHSYATTLLRKTGNLRLVQRACRHASVNTTSIYAHVTAQDVADAAEKLSW